MSGRRLLSRLSFVVLVVGLLAAPAAVSVPAGAAEVLQDGGFEQSTGTPAPTSPAWEQFDSTWPNVICVVGGNCGEDDEFVLPRTGTHWAYFGGVDVLGHNSYLQQQVTITPDRATLTYWYKDGWGSAPYTAVLNVKVDGVVVKQHQEIDNPPAAYELQTVDLSAYADGGQHTLRFDYVNDSALATFFQIDDISLVTSDTIAPETSITSAPAGGVAKSLTVPIGFASPEAGVTFQCALDSGAYAACSSPSAFAVSPGAHTVRVAARDASGNTDASPALVTFKAYDCAALQEAVQKAKKKVKAIRKKLKAARADRLDGKVDRLEKKLKKAKKALRKAKRHYEPCR